MATQMGRPRGRDSSTDYRGGMGSGEWWGMLTQQVNTLSSISAENQQAMQQLLTKTSQMVSRQEMEDILEKRFMDRQESELIHKALERRVEDLETHQRGQPAVTRSWLTLALSASGCLVTLVGVFTSAFMALLIFGLEHFIK